MLTILYIFIGAVIAASGDLQWFKNLESNWGKNKKKTKESFLCLAFALIFGTTLFFMFKGYISKEFGIEETHSFLLYWTSLMLACMQFFYEFIVQNIKKFSEAFLNKLVK